MATLCRYFKPSRDRLAAGGVSTAVATTIVTATLTTVPSCTWTSPQLLSAAPLPKPCLKKKKVTFDFPVSDGRAHQSLTDDSSEEVELWTHPLVTTPKITNRPGRLVFGYGWWYFTKAMLVLLGVGLVGYLGWMVYALMRHQAQTIDELQLMVIKQQEKLEWFRTRVQIKPYQWRRIYVPYGNFTPFVSETNVTCEPVVEEVVLEKPIPWFDALDPLLTYVGGCLLFTLSRFDWTLLWLARTVSYFLSFGEGSAWPGFWLYGPEMNLSGKSYLSILFSLICWNIITVLLWLKAKWVHLTVHCLAPVVSNLIILVLNWSVTFDMQTTGMLMGFLGVLPFAMKAALWAQGASVTRVDWRGHLEKINEVNFLQGWIQRFMSFKPGPDRTVQWKPNRHKNQSRWEWDTRAALDVSSDRPGFRLEADMGAPWVPLKVLDHVKPWSVLLRGKRIGSGFHYKGCFVTPNHVWEVVGKTDTIEVEKNDVRVTLEKVGVLRTHGEDLITFKGVPGVSSIRLSKQIGTVSCFSVTMNGTLDYGVTMGVFDVNRHSHDCTTKPGDSGVPIVDVHGMLLGIHVSSSPGSNHAVTPESVWIDEPVCDCEMYCKCNIMEAGVGWRTRHKRKSDRHRKKRVKWFTDEEYQDLVDKGLSKKAIAELIRMRAYNGFDPFDDDPYDYESCEPVWLDFSTKMTEIDGVALPLFSATQYGRQPMTKFKEEMSDEQWKVFIHEAKKKPPKYTDPRPHVYYKTEKGTGMDWRTFESLDFQVGPSGPEKIQLA
nr:MAG: ORF1a protein [Wenzhou rodent astrovirus 1]